MRSSSAFLFVLCCLLACGDATPQARSTDEPPGGVGAVAPAPVDTPTPPAVATRAGLADSLERRRHSAIVEAAHRVAPAVVSVNVVRRERRVPRSAWDFFFLPRGSERVVEGMGSGFIVSPDGIVVTNQHVTAGAQQIVVTTRDGTDYEATLLGEDPLTDIAVLKIDGRRLPVAPTGRSDDLMIGEWLVAIGNPYGYLLGNTEPSVSAGVVSAVGRNILPSGDDATVYVRMIQTDAAINPGNSGGPLVNALGEVVGVNSFIFSQSGGSVGIGFAIPIERALRVASELQRYGTVRRVWVGLDVAGTERLRDWKRAGGLEVTDVAPGSPAEQAGIRPGDVLVSSGGQALRTFLDWEAVKLDLGPGDALDVTVRRDGRTRQARLKVEDLPTSRAEKVAVLGDLRLISVTPAIRQEQGLHSVRGALIYDIGDAARATGLRQGDVILQINRVAIGTADDARRAFREASGRTPVRVYFERGGGLGYTDFYIR